MKRITHNLRRTETSSILHDSRADSRLFAKMLNLCFDKINELQEEVEKLQTKINDPERKTIADKTIAEHYPPQPYLQPYDKNL